MIGLWHSVSDSPRMKFEFKITKKSTFTLDASMEPIPIPLKFTNVTVQNNRVRGTGKVFWNPEDKLVAELDFQGDTFTGSLYIPSFGTFPLKGVKGRGPFLGLTIMDELEPYRKSNVKKRTEEEIRDAVDQLIASMSLNDKI